MARVSTCLWFGKEAEAAVRFYVSLVPDSRIDHVQRAPGPWPGARPASRSLSSSPSVDRASRR